MFPIDISEFKKRFPILSAHFEFQTLKEFERANINWIIDDARKCDYKATAKVIYHDKQVLRESWVGEKLFKLSEIIEEGKTLEKKAAKAVTLEKKVADARHYLHKINSAIKRTYPEAGSPHKTIFRIEDELLTEEYIRTVIEIQTIAREIDCKKQHKANLFKKNSKFWKAVLEMKIRIEEKSKKRQLRDSEIVDATKSAEQILVNEICTKSATVVARSILAEEYGVEENSMEKRFRGFSKELQKNPNIPADDKTILSLIEMRKKMRKT